MFEELFAAKKPPKKTSNMFEELFAERETTIQPDINISGELFPLGKTGIQTTTPAFLSFKPEPAKAVIPEGMILSPKAEQAKKEAEEAEKRAGKSFFLPALGQTIKEMGQSIARSFLATGKTIEEVSRSSDPNILRAFGTAIKTAEFKPETKLEQAIAGTKEPVSFESIGREILSIGGEDFAKKHENLALGTGLIMAGLDTLPFGGG